MHSRLSNSRKTSEQILMTPTVIMSPKSAHTDGDVGEEVAEASDDKDQHNVGHLNIICP